MDGYPATIENQMVHFYQSLSEKDRRRYAAVEAAKLEHGGTAYIARLFGCKVDTIERGKEDVQQLPQDEAAGRVRKKGGAKTS
jgi:protein subunit release factor A